MVTVLLAALVITAEPAETAPRPNFVVILVDDLRWDELSCTGHPVIRTPHIDRIAREGARFRNAFATTPLCSPSRASFLTGLYPHHHGITDNTNRSEASHRLATFPRELQQAGYETAYIGKWHMGNDDSPRPGFDRWVALPGQGTSFDPTFNVDGRREKFTGHTTDVINQFAREFVRAPHTKPFCLYVAHKALHPELVQHDDGSISDPTAARFLAPERHQQLYVDAPVPRRLNVTDTVDGKPALQRPVAGLPPLGPDTGTPDHTVRERWRMLAGVDEGVGQLCAALEEIGRLDDTLFVFTSDHGYWYGEHGLSVERRLPYEEGARIPLLLRYPPLIAPGTLIDELSLSIDLAPTLLDLAGVSPREPLDGRSLVPLLHGESPEWRNSFLIEYSSDTVFPRIRNMGYRAVRTGRYKYIEYRDLESMNELYDLTSDPYELHNRINDPDAADIVRQLQAELRRLSS